MAKKRARKPVVIKHAVTQATFTNQRKVIAAAVLIAVVALTGVLAAANSSLRAILISSVSPEPTPPTAPTPQSSPLQLSKEYVYAGGRLIATEEPTSSTSTNDATFVQQSVPTSLTTGQSAGIIIKMRNIGSTNWDTTNYKLGSQNPQDNTTWGLNRVTLPAPVAPGTEVTFSFNITAPTTAGTYPFQWKMVQDGAGGGFFGQATTSLSITVTGGGGGATPNAAFLEQIVPQTMTAGQSYSVSITMNNTGGVAWTSPTFKLGSQNPQNNTTWGLSRVNLPGGTTVNPGSGVTFTFSVTAPTTPGTYPFQWRMIQETGAGVWFGALTTNLAISVQASGGGSSGFSAALNGVGSLTVNNSASLNLTGALTLEAWIKPTSLGGSQGILERFGAAGGGAGGYALRLNGSIVEFYLFSTLTSFKSVSATTIIAANQWTHVAGVYSGTEMAIYINGMRAGTRTTSTNPASGSNSLKIGAKGDNPTLFRFNGLIDEARVSATALYTANFTASPNPQTDANTKGLWKFTNQNANDSSVNANHGTANGTVSYSTDVPGGSGGVSVAAPSNLAAQPSFTLPQITLSWQDNSNNENGFKLERQIGSGAFQQIATLGANSVGYVDANLTTGTTYSYRVIAYLGQVNSLPSNTASATAGGASSSPPSDPSSLVATGINSTQINLSWTAGSGQTEFRIERSAGSPTNFSEIGTAPGNVTTFSDLGVAAPTTYYYRVRAFNGLYSGYTNVANATPPGGGSNLPAPTNLRATAVTYNSVRLAWDYSATGFAYFKIERRTPPNPSFAEIASLISSGQYLNKGLSQTTTYVYRVRAFDGMGGTSPYSTELQVTTTSYFSPLQEVSLFSGSGSAGYLEGDAATAKWKKPAGAAVGGIDPVSGYQVLFIADTENHCIRMLYLDGPAVGASLLIAGSGIAGYWEGDGNPFQARYNKPQGLAILPDPQDPTRIGALLIADTGNHVIRQLLVPDAGKTAWSPAPFSGAGGIGNVDGSAAACMYNSPIGITVAANGLIYVADNGNGMIRSLDTGGTSAALFGGPGLDLNPIGLVVSQTSGLLYFTDKSYTIWQVDATGAGSVIAGSGNDAFADGIGTAASFSTLYHLDWASTPEGEMLYIADFGNHRIRQLALANNEVSTYAGSGQAGYLNGPFNSAKLKQPVGIVYSPEHYVYVTEWGNNRIRIIQ